MPDAKPVASPGSELLARKGAARPAMRRPTFGDGQLDDPGGDGRGEAGSAPRIVHRHQAAIARAFTAATEPEPSGRMIAFTVRLDAARHRRLRRACAIEHRSARQLFVEALDAVLARISETERLVAGLPAAPGPSRADRTRRKA